MNTQNTEQTLHFKVEHNNEFRRFFLNNPTFADVEKTLKTLYSIPEASSIKIKFLDDEKDWVSLSTDQELQYAVELAERPMRLSLNVISATPAFPGVPSHWEGKGKWGHRGKCGKWKDGDDVSLSMEERMARKSTRLSSRITQLEAKLAKEDLPSDRTRVLTWRLSILREKLAHTQARQATSTPIPQEPASAPVQEEAAAVEVNDHGCHGHGRHGGPGGCHGRGRHGGPGGFHGHGGPSGPGGCRGRGGRHGPGGPGGCRGRGGRKHIDPDAPVTPVRLCKMKLWEARQSGNEEEIQKCKEALWEAKQKKREENGDLEDSALLREKKQHKMVCKQNLRQARQSGDQTQINICREELMKAKKACWEVRQAKRESKQ